MIKKPPKVSRVVAFSQLSVVQKANNELREILSLSIRDNGIRTCFKLINAEFPALAWAWMIYCQPNAKRMFCIYPRSWGNDRGLSVVPWISYWKSILDRAQQPANRGWSLNQGCCYKQANTTGNILFLVFCLNINLSEKTCASGWCGWRKSTWTWINKSNPLPSTCNFENLIWTERLELDFAYGENAAHFVIIHNQIPKSPPWRDGFFPAN